jgi:ribosomal protein L7/L12
MITDSEIRSAITRYITNGQACLSHGEELIEELTQLNNRTLLSRAEEIVAAYPNAKIQGIKELRLRYSLGLREAKELYEQALVKHCEQALMNAIDACTAPVTPLLTQVTLDRPPF